MRKKILNSENLDQAEHSSLAELDVATIATALVTSEDAQYPLENAFDRQRGPGGSRWVAAQLGEQTLILEFDTPQKIDRVILEIEELEMSRNQELQLSVSVDQGVIYQELRRQEYNFSPPGTTFEREEWEIFITGVTHIRLWIKPDKGDKSCRATLTTFALQ
jgi:hypothetical protein